MNESSVRYNSYGFLLSTPASQQRVEFKRSCCPGNLLFPGKVIRSIPALVIFVVLSAHLACAQAPGLLWTTNINARVFAVDAQTNVYADAGGKVIKLDSAGAALETNILSSYPGMAQRDTAGNFYYAGVYPGTLTSAGYSYTNSPVFLTKFTDSGTVVWTVGFLGSGYLRAINIEDLQVDEDGNVLVGYTYRYDTVNHHSFLAKFDSNGTNTWRVEPPRSSFVFTQGSLRIGAVSSTNGYVVTYVNHYSSDYFAALSLFNANGGTTTLANWTAPQPTRPIGNSLGENYTVADGYLTKRDNAGSVVFSHPIEVAAQWPIGEDPWNGVHVGSDSGWLARYDIEGNLAWSINLPAPCTAMVSDTSGNRFISMGDGTIARLGAESLSAPNITNNPSGQTVLSGSNAVFEVGSSGTTPLHYFWLLNGTDYSESATPTLIVSNATSLQAGTYSVIVSNFVGSVTSTPALLRVKSVAIYNNGQLLTNGTYMVAGPPTLTIRSAFAGGSSFYTLDGSTPSFAPTSTFYTLPFIVWNSATVRAIGYSADFLQSEKADAVTLIVPPADHTLSASSSGGGSVNLNPPGGTYASTNVVTATAVPAAGYSFLYWLGDTTGVGPSINVSMERDKTIRAVFGTTLSTTVAGNGQIQPYPASGPYAYGSTVRLTAIPDPGNYFGVWGNAASGNTNPLYFIITAPTQTVSSVFGATPGGQAALTVLINGHGRVNSNPRANAYTLNQNVTLTATPDAGADFLGWSGDATGALNPLSITMNAPKTITASFTARPSLRVDRPGLEGLFPDGFRLTLLSDPGSVFQIFASSNLTAWTSLGSVSNSFGQVQFTDTSSPIFPQRFYKAAP